MILFRSLKHQSFGLLWTGQTISRLGDSLYQIALAWWVLEKTGSAAAMGSVLIFSFIPTLLFLLIGGVTVDRVSRLHVMLISDVSSGIIISIVAFLAFDKKLEIWHVYVAGMLFGFANAFFQPAYAATVPEIIPSELLTSANSLTSLSKQLSKTVGPLLGAIFISLGGITFAFALDAFSFFISALLLIPLLGKHSFSGEIPKKASVLHEMSDGIKMVFGVPWLWITIAILSLGNLSQWGPIRVSLPFLVKEHLFSDVNVLGLVYSMLALGSVVSAVWFGRLIHIRKRGAIAYCAFVIGGLMTSIIGLPIPIFGIAFAGFMIGATSEAFNLIWIQTIQEIVPRQFLGRVSSIDYLGSFALLPVGYAIAGWMTDQFSASLVFVVGGLITASLAVLGFAHPAIRRFD